MVFGGFEIGKTYNRRSDIHDRFGGQRQGGISTPKDHPVIIAFTGASGLQHGYADGWTTDGLYRYFGEGQSGDMSWKGGNIAIREHAAMGEDLLLFQTVGEGNVRFLGEFVCAGYDIEQAPDGTGAMRQSIVFSLLPASDLDGDAARSLASDGETADLQILRREALAAVSAPAHADQIVAKRNIYERSNKIRSYVLARANGYCDACSRPAPFVSIGGIPYLEPHHIRRLGDGAPDDPRYMAAVCPNCHREIHYGANGREINERLQVEISSRETALETA
jgi:5-methylcytosine-specific restriction enzyme A